ncbi:potassium-transporting ATPase subunit KdpC [Acidiphilium sp. PA]|uniref:potassium-transporting ATPase subunit KdpC n=1 Tax=Acidiphilium sp. PA TaxID=2871705 RepID=UPI0022430989|nr:potassium-transporting ATPase subunit KdpC [Acidiphilium sp. PA]MCW8305543.1 potassium-transporting ATPase subunit KdpC [Acidiphilium sp. PA]
MRREIRPALSLVLLFTLVLGVALPAAFTGLAQAVLPFQANGSLLERNGQIIGSALIGQSFAGPTWFTPRPSALTGTDAAGKTIATPYDAAESGGSSSGPTNAGMIARVRSRIAAYRKTYGPGPVPDDAVTTSGSGLDPDISLENALRQAPAIAAARKLPAATVTALVNRLAAHRLFGVIGTDHVNVLKLNLALSRIGAP